VPKPSFVAPWTRKQTSMFQASPAVERSVMTDPVAIMVEHSCLVIHTTHRVSAACGPVMRAAGACSGPVAGVWIGYVEVPPSVETKIRARRGVTGDQVRAACQWPAVPWQAVWHDHPEHGRRLLVVARDEQGRM
jgi:hypothetical protein